MQPNDIIITHKSVGNVYSYRLVEKLNKDGSVSLVGGTALLLDTIQKRPAYSHIPFDHPTYYDHWEKFSRLIKRLIIREELFSTEETPNLIQLQGIYKAVNSIDLSILERKTTNCFPTPRSWDAAAQLFGAYTSEDIKQDPAQLVDLNVTGSITGRFIAVTKITNPLQPNSESKMEPVMDKIIVEQTLVKGRVLQDMDQDQLMRTMRELESEDSKLASFTTESVAISAMRQDIKHALAKVVARLDSIYVSSQPVSVQASN